MDKDGSYEMYKLIAVSGKAASQAKCGSLKAGPG